MAKPCQITAVVVEASIAGEPAAPFEDRQCLEHLDRDGCAVVVTVKTLPVYDKSWCR